MARASSDARAALCLVALLAMSSLMSCQAAGRIIGTTGADPTTNCVHALGCAPPPPGKPDSDLLCRVYCYQRGYNLLRSYCKPDGGGTCCCVKP